MALLYLQLDLKKPGSYFIWSDSTSYMIHLVWPLDGGFRRAGGAKWPENGWFWSGLHGMFRAVSEVVYMRKVGVRDENYPLTIFYVRWMRFCV